MWRQRLRRLFVVGELLEMLLSTLRDGLERVDLRARLRREQAGREGHEDGKGNETAHGRDDSADAGPSCLTEDGCATLIA